MKSSFQEFKELFMETYEEFIEINKVKREIETTISSISVINTCISKVDGLHSLYPVIVGNGLSRASISYIGTFPPYSFNKNYIYPLHYSVKKRFKPHLNYKKSMNNKVLYICNIENDGINVTADDGYVWKGTNLWKDLKNDLGITDEFSSIEDFMGLTNHIVIKMIENIGDVSVYDGYVPLNKRSS
jgi:hypothetical protein